MERRLERLEARSLSRTVSRTVSRTLSLNQSLSFFLSLQHGVTCGYGHLTTCQLSTLTIAHRIGWNTAKAGVMIVEVLLGARVGGVGRVAQADGVLHGGYIVGRIGPRQLRGRHLGASCQTSCRGRQRRLLMSLRIWMEVQLAREPIDPRGADWGLVGSRVCLSPIVPL